MQTELGNVTHDYWWRNGCYFRRPIVGGPVETWNGKTWKETQTLRKAA